MTPENLYEVALLATDEVLGQGAYREANRHNPNPGVRAAIMAIYCERCRVGHITDEDAGLCAGCCDHNDGRVVL